MVTEPQVTSSAGKLPVEVFGADLDGRQFIEQTRTVTITRDGATIPLANKLAPDCELIVRNPATNQEAIARVVDLVHDAIVVHVYGIVFVDPSVNLWQLELPAVRERKTVALECGGCRTVVAVQLSEIEMEILESKKSLKRHCDCSNTFTAWKQTDREVTERPPSKREPASRVKTPPPGQEPGPRTGQDRRKEKRTAMKAAACIRCKGAEAVVECEDVSRGGFRFKSPECFALGTSIEAAVPYAKGSNNIFVAARIVYEQELSDGIHRHGVAYVESIVRKK